jgi:hypothetical protein
MKDGEAENDTCRLVVEVAVAVVDEVLLVVLGRFRCGFKANAAPKAFFAPSADGVQEEEENACVCTLSLNKKRLREANIIQRRLIMVAMTFEGLMVLCASFDGSMIDDETKDSLSGRLR